jgi:methyl-accepting chemotaxis protein
MGVQISREVSENLREIVEKVEKVDQLIAETAVGSNEQSQGIAQVNTAVLEIDKVTQANAACAEESASAAAELNGQANALKVALKDLMSLVEQESH